MRTVLIASLLWMVPGLAAAVPPAPPATYRAFVHEQNRLVCERTFQCCGGRATTIAPFQPDVAGCIGVGDAAFDSPSSWPSQQEQLIADGSNRFDPAAAEACLAAYATGAAVCGADSEAAPSAFTCTAVTGGLDEGAVCEVAYGTCAPGLFCPRPPGWDDADPSTHGSSACRAFPKEGESCNVDNDLSCAVGTYCPMPPGYDPQNAATHLATTCTVYKKTGDACTRADECGPFRAESTCRSDTGACGPFLNPGETCLLSFECRLTLCDHARNVCPEPDHITVTEQLCPAPGATFSRSGGGLSGCSSAPAAMLALLGPMLFLRRRRATRVRPPSRNA